MKVLHVITGLGMGGAEMMLSKLLAIADCEIEHIVISMTNLGEVGERISAEGTTVIVLNINSLRSGLEGAVTLALQIRKMEPDVIQTWMYHADLFGGVVAFILGHRNIVWNIRHSNFDPKKTKRFTKFTVKACALLSKVIPRKIISNSMKSAEIHKQLGYKEEKFTIIPNGFDLDKFCVDKEKKYRFRSEIGIDKEVFLIGFIARFDPQKNHFGFIKAASLLLEKHRNVHFLLCGASMDYSNKELNNWITSAGLSAFFELLGLRSDIDRITASLDLATTSSSYGEAFPNVIGEAMACGVPCVVTDVGDSAWIVGDGGLVVLPSEPQALADAWGVVIEMEVDQRIKLGEVARKRIEDNFSIDKVAAQYMGLYRELVK